MATESEPKVVLAAAEQHLRDEEPAVGLQKAELAHTLFKDAGDSAGAARALFQVCLGFSLKGEWSHAVEVAEGQLQRYKELREDFGEAYMLFTIALLKCDRNDEEDQQIALKYVERARELFRGIGDRGMEAATLLVRASLALKSDGELEHIANEAQKLAGGALLLYRGVGDRRGEANATHWLARAQHFLRKPEAIETSFAAADIFKEVGDQLFASEELKQVAEWETRNNGNLDEGLRAAQEALTLVRLCRRASRDREVRTLSVLCSVHVARNENSEAVHLAKESIERFKEAGDQAAVTAMLMILVQARLNNFSDDESEEALQLAEEARAACAELKDIESAATVSSLLSLICLRRGTLEKARAHAKSCLACQGVDLLAKGVASQVLVGCCLLDKKIDEALQFAKETRSMMQNHPIKEGMTLLTLCNVHFQKEDYKTAMRCAREAEAIFFECEEKFWEAETYQAQAELHQALSEHHAAVRCAEKASNIWFSLNDGGAMAYGLVFAAQNQCLLVAKLEEMNKESENPPSIEIKANKKKALRMSTRAKDYAKQVGAERTSAAALCALAQAEALQGNYNAALDATDEAISISRKLGDQKLLASTLILSAQTRIMAMYPEEAPDEAAEALTLFRANNDSKGELLTLNLLREIEEQQSVARLPRRETVQKQVTQRVPEGNQSQVAAPTPAAAGPSEDEIVKTLQDVTKKLVGGTKDLELDRPLMEAGISSMTAILYRQQLATALEGVNFPVTLVFDYPTIGAISDLVLEQGARLGSSSYP